MDRQVSALQKQVSTALLCGLGVALGMSATDQGWLAAAGWGLAGGLVAAPVLYGASRAVRAIEQRRT